ncbi:hypothetical protein pEaSNUABM37_00309 [Erwinia phage pEa_SNUABM_37]|nr:hypothetical protein pEaSNUABM37_00309 [Erwinia phage pEa_SNUABM_37]QXO10777.1 hypothetical protein pEaSNUABM48_00309 [Erwinia phage pEa_SNUABM_48]
MSDFSELNEYLMPLISVERRERIITACQELSNAGYNQVQPDVDRLLNMSNDGEADSVIDDLHAQLFEHLYSITLDLGFVWPEEINWVEDFNLLSDILHGITLLDNVEDYGEITRVLNDDLMSNEEKVVDILSSTLAKDMHLIMERVQEVMPETLEGIATSIVTPYAEEDSEPPTKELDYVKERLVRFEAKLYQGLAYTYIASGGALGVTYDSLLLMYNDQLGALIDYDKTILTQELIGFALVSDIIDDMLQDEVCKQLDIYIDDKLTLQPLGAIVTGFFA